MRKLKGVYFWVMAFLVTLALYFVCLLRHCRVVLSGAPRDGRQVHRVATLWGRLLIRLMPGWRVEVVGREHLPADRSPMVIVANHESFADIWGIYYLDLQFRWLSKEAIFKVPLVGRAMRWSHYVAVERGRKDSTHAAMEASAQRLRQGLSMFFFPEGTRSVDGTIRPFKLGAFKLACDGKVPVLPIAIHGAAELLPAHSWMPGVAVVQIKILPPLPPPAADEDLEAYAAGVRAQIVAAHDRMI